MAYYVDIAFPKAKLVVEIDGREFHEGPEPFEQDRLRQNDLVNAGWRILRFTANAEGASGHGPCGDQNWVGRAAALKISCSISLASRHAAR